MRKLTKAEKAIRLFYYWCGKLQIKKIIPSTKDNRISCRFALINWNNDDICLVYNARRIGAVPMSIVISDMFHEIGHMINNLPYDTVDEEVESEYQAELFSIRMMRKYFPKDLRKMLKRIKKYNRMDWWRKKEPVYFQAFTKIKEYKKLL